MAKSSTDHSYITIVLLLLITWILIDNFECKNNCYFDVSLKLQNGMGILNNFSSIKKFISEIIHLF